MSSDLTQLRADFDAQARRSLSLPVAGALVWAAAGIAGLFLDTLPATIVLIVSTGAIFPLALALSRRFGERLLSNSSPLAALMAQCTLMVNLLWAVHISLLILDVNLVPLTLGISLGLHWVVFSWIVGHSVGMVHAIARTGLVTAVWWTFPDHRVSVVAAAVVLAYVYAVYVLATRKTNTTS